MTGTDEEWGCYACVVTSDPFARRCCGGGVAESITKGRDFIAEVMPDRLAQLIHGEISEPAEVGSFLGTVVCGRRWGQGVAAGAWAVKIADPYSEITGLDVLVTATVAGPMFEYTWGVRHATAASADEATAKLMASESYAAVSDRVLYRWRDRGLVEQLAGGIFLQPDLPADPDLVEIAVRAPVATLCLTTALARHGLVDDIPPTIDVALPRSRRRAVCAPPCAKSAGSDSNGWWGAGAGRWCGDSESAVRSFRSRDVCHRSGCRVRGVRRLG